MIRELQQLRCWTQTGHKEIDIVLEYFTNGLTSVKHANAMLCQSNFIEWFYCFIVVSYFIIMISARLLYETNIAKLKIALCLIGDSK